MRHDQVRVPLDCGGTAILTVEVDPAHCLNVGHLCPTPEEIAAFVRAGILDAEAEARAAE